MSAESWSSRLRESVLMIRESEAISLDRVHRSPGYFSLFGKTVNDWRFSLLSSLPFCPALCLEGLWECHLTVNSQVRCVRSEAWPKVGPGCDMDPGSGRGNIVVKMSSHLTSVTDLLQTDQSENSNWSPVIRHQAPGHWVTVTWLGKSLFQDFKINLQLLLCSLLSTLHPVQNSSKP